MVSAMSRQKHRKMIWYTSIKNMRIVIVMYLAVAIFYFVIIAYDIVANVILLNLKLIY